MAKKQKAASSLPVPLSRIPKKSGILRSGTEVRSKQAGKQSAADKPQRTRIFVIGESPLVEEYAELCAAKGYDAFIKWNTNPNKLPSFSSKAIQRANTIPTKTSIAIELTNGDREQKQNNLQMIDRALPTTAAIVSSSVTTSATEQTTWLQHKHRLVGVCALPSFSQHLLHEVAPTVYTPKETVEVVQHFFQSLGKEIEVVQDRVGMVLPRIVCQLVNEATFAVQEEVASPQDIDTAMKLGTNYPYGPIEWGNRIGFQHVYQVLQALQADLQEDRYRISPLLTALAQTGEWWKKT
jgi:3-hydroxybutyryl-CoA dehydrogenase